MKLTPIKSQYLASGKSLGRLEKPAHLFASESAHAVKSINLNDIVEEPAFAKEVTVQVKDEAVAAEKPI